MRQSRFTQEQTIAILAEQEQERGITFYKWKARFGGPDVSDENPNQPLRIQELDSSAGRCAFTIKNLLCPRAHEI